MALEELPDTGQGDETPPCYLDCHAHFSDIRATLYWFLRAFGCSPGLTRGMSDCWERRISAVLSAQSVSPAKAREVTGRAFDLEPLLSRLHGPQRYQEAVFEDWTQNEVAESLKGLFLGASFGEVEPQSLFMGALGFPRNEWPQLEGDIRFDGAPLFGEDARDQGSYQLVMIHYQLHGVSFVHCVIGATRFSLGFERHVFCQKTNLEESQLVFYPRVGLVVALGHATQSVLAVGITAGLDRALHRELMMGMLRLGLRPPGGQEAPPMLLGAQLSAHDYVTAYRESQDIARGYHEAQQQTRSVAAFLERRI